MADPRFTGVIVPMVTPLTADFQIDVPAVGRLVDHLLAGGTDGIFILGSAGEGPLLPPALMRPYVVAAREAVGDRAPLLIGISAPSTAQTLANLEIALTAAPDGVVATVPFYLPVTKPDEIVAHYRALAEASSVPVLAYDIPQYLGWGIGADVVGRLREIPNLAGIKLSAPDYAKLERVLLDHAGAPDFAILLGHSDLFVPGILLGADGIVPVSGNAHPRLPAAVWAARTAGPAALAAAVDRLRRVAHAYFALASPAAATKAACQAQGLCEPWVMPPYAAASGDALAAIHRLAAVHCAG